MITFYKNVACKKKNELIFLFGVSPNEVAFQFKFVLPEL